MHHPLTLVINATTKSNVKTVILLLLLLLTTSSPSHAGLKNHWLKPVPEQGVTTPSPEQCGLCHRDRLAEWSGSRHAKAFSPGLTGQLFASSLKEIKECLICHTPLTEQLNHATTYLGGQKPGTEKKRLAKHGIFCASCHLRQGRLITPGSFKNQTAHPKQKRVPWFSESQFCAPCHQFPQRYAINGKPLENTLLEWQQSRFARQGVTCQKCHMPEGKHLFRGVHDPDMVRQGVTITVKESIKKATLTIKSSGVGHYFPTYIVPKIKLSGILIDRKGAEIPASLRNKTLQRDVQYSANGWQEIKDSRLAPGESASINVPWQFGRYIGRKIRFRIEVDPDNYYINNVYKPLLDKADSLRKRTIQQADKEARANSYILYEKIVDHPLEKQQN
jgi:hypothetical protein